VRPISPLFFYADTREAVITIATEGKFEKLVAAVEEIRQIQTDEKSDLRKATAKYDQWLRHQTSVQVRIQFRTPALHHVNFSIAGCIRMVPVCRGRT
jgi:hypothetical protein